MRPDSKRGGVGSAGEPGAGVARVKNNVLTASRMACILRCQRQHYWSFEVGLRKASTGKALWIGSAWHRAMEARWKKSSYAKALKLAIGSEGECDAYIAATVAALLAAYYRHYGNQELAGVKMLIEKQFKFPIFGSREFTAEGKIDRLGVKADARNILVEYKSTGESLLPDSGYWTRLRFNMQLLQYVTAAHQLGIDVHEVYYDVVRKPSIKPKKITDRDNKGRKVVIDKNGERVWKTSSVPQESASAAKNWTVREHVETPDEFSNRLYEDCLSRPDFYFSRKEVPIFDSDIQEFKTQRVTICQTISFLRSKERQCAKPEHAWPRFVSEDNCKFCSFSSFCLASISPDLNNPPDGFSVRPFNPELNEQDATVEKDPVDAAQS